MKMNGLRASRLERGQLDEASFDALFRECMRDVHGYALSLLGERAAAEDVTALAFERLLRARRRLDPRRGSPRALLFTIARNAALDELRRRRRQPLASPAAERLASEPALAAAETEEIERRESVRRALPALPMRDRELVLLKLHGQLSNAAPAPARGITDANAGARLSRRRASRRGG